MEKNYVENFDLKIFQNRKSKNQNQKIPKFGIQNLKISKVENFEFLNFEILLFCFFEKNIF